MEFVQENERVKWCSLRQLDEIKCPVTLMHAMCHKHHQPTNDIITRAVDNPCMQQITIHRVGPGPALVHAYNDMAGCPVNSAGVRASMAQ